MIGGKAVVTPTSNKLQQNCSLEMNKPLAGKIKQKKRFQTTMRFQSCQEAKRKEETEPSEVYRHSWHPL